NGTLLQMIGLNPPYQETVQIQNTRLDQPLPPGSAINLVAAATAPNLRGIQADWTDPYMQHWSLDIQRQLDSNTVITVGYFGSKGTHLIGAFELNALPPGFAIAKGPTGCAVGTSTTPTAPCQVAGQAFGVAGLSTNILDQVRPFRGYRSLTIIQPRYNSSYHSLQVFGTRRFAGKSQASVAYTWSKNLTDNQTDRSTAPQSSYDIGLDKGRAALDRRHVFTANYNYELPFFLKHENGLVKNVLGGWEASGIVVYNTGLPFTPSTSSYDPAGLGIIPALVAGGRPNLLCDPNENAPHTQQEWFNTACFERNPTTNSGLRNVIGNAGRGIIEGPPTFRVDFSMLKNVRFGETKQLQLRAEAFNVFNHTNFKTIASTNVTVATFGQISQTRDPRTIQLGAKFIF
ncbi:MAG TPA: hypothetical protein VKB02_14510, partial [Pyrinomonadaceae bacterium]|nr:hypothetical protein [Pyrinomonadaceae bacterium]